MHILPDKNTLSQLIKKPLSVENQLLKLSEKGLKYDDLENAKKILLSTNYYYFTGYLHKFKSLDIEGEEIYKTDLKIEDLYSLIQIDTQLRSILLQAIDYIERDLKTKIAYYLAQDDKIHGSVNYLYSEYFESKIVKSDRYYREKINGIRRNHRDFIRHYEGEYNKKVQNSTFVKHHSEKYWGCLPIWVAVEIMTIGNIKHLYTKLLPTAIQNQVASSLGLSIGLMKNYLSCLNDFRNLLAHNVRIYDLKISYTPSTNKKDPIDTTNYIFDYVCVLKYLLSDNDFWNCTILVQLSIVMGGMPGNVEAGEWGFPQNWYDILAKK
ncbi:Abi family protein [Proteiniclasticum ruminis]|uniref:Abi family protein n=1 Tax=Proteiniclasticum ruminis TaxID=398199 RepID=UPI0028A8E5AA|nr:Abi family protein [Proteiniclasticum ruminis]